VTRDELERAAAIGLRAGRAASARHAECGRCAGRVDRGAGGGPGLRHPAARTTCGYASPICRSADHGQVRRCSRASSAAPHSPAASPRRVMGAERAAQDRAEPPPEPGLVGAGRADHVHRGRCRLFLLQARRPVRPALRWRPGTAWIWPLILDGRLTADTWCCGRPATQARAGAGGLPGSPSASESPCR